MNENSFNKIPQTNKTEESNPNKMESLDVEIRMAIPEEWKTLRDLRLKILEEEGSKGNIATPWGIRKMKRRKDEEWKDLFFGEDRFSVIAFAGEEEVGMGRAEKKKEVWYLFNLGVIEEFQRKGIGPKITAIRLKEIKARGGKEIRSIIKEENDPSLKVAEHFGFKRDNNLLGKLRNLMILDDVNNPTTTKKIEEVLDKK